MYLHVRVDKVRVAVVLRQLRRRVAVPPLRLAVRERSLLEDRNMAGETAMCGPQRSTR